MRRLLAVVPVLALLAGCASTSDVAARTTPDPASTAVSSPCPAAPSREADGSIVWAGTKYVQVAQSTLTDADRGDLLFRDHCNHSESYSVKGVPLRCEVMVFTTDAYDVYAPHPVPSDCPAMVTTPQPRTTGLPASLADCPKVPLQKSGQRVSEDFGDVIVAGDSTFVAASPVTTSVTPSDLGQVQFTVRCSYSELNDVTQQQTPELRSHDSTYVPAGAPVYALKGWPPSCRLAAQHDNQWHAYLALDPKAGPGVPLPCATASPSPSTMPSPTQTFTRVVTGTFGTCPSPPPTKPGTAMALPSQGASGVR